MSIDYAWFIFFKKQNRYVPFGILTKCPLHPHITRLCSSYTSLKTGFKFRHCNFKWRTLFILVAFKQYGLGIEMFILTPKYTL